MTEREAFEAAIKKDRYDQTTRLVFADWLEEHGFDDEAVVQRKWTPKYQKSEDWLMEYAKDIAATDYYKGVGYYEYRSEIRTFSYEYLLVLAAEHLESGEETALIGLNGPDSRETMEEFWKHYRVVTGADVKEGYAITFFACDC